VILVYFSQVSNNTHRLVLKTGARSVRIPVFGEGPVVDEPYILICPTYQMDGGIPHQVAKWLRDNPSWMTGVIGTGNRNFAGEFGKAGQSISQRYGVPELMDPIEISGTKSDVQRLKELAVNDYALS
jgi:protein involved in ribonucleotide reduction